MRGIQEIAVRAALAAARDPAVRKQLLGAGKAAGGAALREARGGSARPKRPKGSGGQLKKARKKGRSTKQRKRGGR